MSNPVPKQKKSNENITRHVQEGTGVCFPNPPQTPPIHRSSFALDILRSQFCSGMFPPLFRIRRNVSGQPGGSRLPDSSRSNIEIPFIRKDSLLQTIFTPPGYFQREKPRRPAGEGMPYGAAASGLLPSALKK
jgi:hypothetical protein